jgi:hypothetical protein
MGSGAHPTSEGGGSATAAAPAELSARETAQCPKSANVSNEGPRRPRTAMRPLATDGCAMRSSCLCQHAVDVSNPCNKSSTKERAPIPRAPSKCGFASVLSGARGFVPDTVFGDCRVSVRAAMSFDDSIQRGRPINIATSPFKTVCTVARKAKCSRKLCLPPHLKTKPSTRPRMRLQASGLRLEGAADTPGVAGPGNLESLLAGMPPQGAPGSRRVLNRSSALRLPASSQPAERRAAARARLRTQTAARCWLTRPGGSQRWHQQRPAGRWREVCA